jgi:DNA transformation protein and related proteins
MRRAKSTKGRSQSRASARWPTSPEPSGLLGLGPKSLAVLSAAGISSRDQLERLGPVKAFIAAKAVEPAVTLNLLWSIAGAITDTHWSKLPGDLRSSLLLEYDAYCDAVRTIGLTCDTSLGRKRGR